MREGGAVAAARAVIECLVADGGSQPMPFAQAPWGDHYVQVLDKHGLLWHVNVPG